MRCWACWCDRLRAAPRREPRSRHFVNLSDGYLNALQVSPGELEEIVTIARLQGAAGAKLTGGGRHLP